MRQSTQLVIACILGLLLLGCDDGSSASSRVVQDRLKSKVASGATSFDFANGTSFTWDRMYVFGPYSRQAEVEQSLGFKWPGYRQTSIESSDGVCLVVFVTSGSADCWQSSVVCWYEQPRSIELVSLAKKRDGYGRSEAVFQVHRGKNGVELKPLATGSGPTPAR